MSNLPNKTREAICAEIEESLMGISVGEDADGMSYGLIDAIAEARHETDLKGAGDILRDASADILDAALSALGEAGYAVVRADEREQLLAENLSLQAMAGVGGDDGIDIAFVETLLEPILRSQKQLFADGTIGLLDENGKRITAIQPSVTGLRKLVIGEVERVVSAIEAVMDAAEYAAPLINAVKAARLKATHYANGMHIMSDLAQRAQEQREGKRAIATLQREADGMREALENLTLIIEDEITSERIAMDEWRKIGGPDWNDSHPAIARLNRLVASAEAARAALNLPPQEIG